MYLREVVENVSVVSIRDPFDGVSCTLTLGDIFFRGALWLFKLL